MDHEIKLDHVETLYNHKNYSGTCGKSVTVEDIKKRFYHPYFGGRDAKVHNGTFTATEHTG